MFKLSHNWRISIYANITDSRYVNESSTKSRQRKASRLLLLLAKKLFFSNVISKQDEGVVMTKNNLDVNGDEKEVVSKQWQREYDLRDEETRHDKSEGITDALLALLIITAVAYPASQLFFPYIIQFFKHMSKLSNGI